MGSYAEMKKANPDLPILVREASGTEAKLIARYGECWRAAAAERNMLVTCGDMLVAHQAGASAENQAAPTSIHSYVCNGLALKPGLERL